MIRLLVDRRVSGRSSWRDSNLGIPTPNRNGRSEVVDARNWINELNNAELILGIREILGLCLSTLSHGCIVRFNYEDPNDLPITGSCSLYP